MDLFLLIFILFKGMLDVLGILNFLAYVDDC